MINAVFDRIRVCRGVRIRGGRRRLTCGGEVDEVTRSEVLNLVGKFLRRVEKYRDVLLGNERTPFDMYIDELENFIGYLRSRLSEVNNPGQLDNAERTIIELRKALLTVSSTMLRLLRRVRKRWLMRGRLELEELIIKLVKSEVTVLVNGELNKEEEGFSIYLYAGHLIVVVEKFPRNRGITVRLMLTNIRGIHVISPRLFDNNVLRAMQYGLLLTDGTVDRDGYSEMSTTHLWQGIIWPLIFPGKNSIYVKSININDGGITITWFLTSIDYKFKGRSVVDVKRGFVGGEVVGFDDWLFLWFLLFAVFGDGNVDVQDEYDVREIRLFMGGGKYVMWGGPIIERLRGLGFRGGEYGWEWVVRVRSSRAAKLAREWVGDPVFGVIIGDLARLSDAVKLRQLIGLAGVGYRPKGRSSVIIGSVKMTVRVRDGYVELVAVRKDGAEIARVLESLRALGIIASVTPWGGGGMSACV